MYIPIEDLIQQVSETLARLNLSLTAVAGGVALLVVLLMFALREAASWFFKVDHLRRDLRKMSRMMMDLESEVRALHELVETTRGRDVPTVHTPSMSPPLSPPLSSLTEKAPAEKPPAFPISH